MTLNVSLAKEVRLPLVPVRPIVAVPSGAEVEAVSVTCWPFVVIVNGDAGVAVTPLGNP